MYINFSNRIKIKFERQIDTLFGIVLFIMLSGRNRNFEFLHIFYKNHQQITLWGIKRHIHIINQNTTPYEYIITV